MSVESTTADQRKATLLAPFYKRYGEETEHILKEQFDQGIPYRVIGMKVGISGTGARARLVRSGLVGLRTKSHFPSRLYQPPPVRVIQSRRKLQEEYVKTGVISHHELGDDRVSPTEPGFMQDHADVVYESIQRGTYRLLNPFNQGLLELLDTLPEPSPHEIKMKLGIKHKVVPVLKKRLIGRLDTLNKTYHGRRTHK